MKKSTILIEISDKRVIKGTVLGKETLTQWANQIYSKTEPQLIPLIETHEPEGKKIVEVKILEYPLKPVSVRGKCFRRMKNSNRVMNAQEISETFGLLN
ncbi:AlbA family DNA-binding domain-containing protein [Methanosarcina sp. T3]|uniref:AlbA family DNA-binding domain-containing protein n=1 Tax=Methanosarcina sp. T3 TaxID=3439062 RepID=UPI003F82AE0D